jgi:hypothetical protein
MYDCALAELPQYSCTDPTGGNCNGELEMLLYDATGRKVYESDPFNKRLEFNRAGFSPGRYLLEISGNGQLFRDHLFIQ